MTRRCNLNTVCSGAKAEYIVTERPWEFRLFSAVDAIVTPEIMADAPLVACGACKVEIEKRAGGGLVDDYCRHCGCHLLVKPEQFKRPGLWNTCRVCETSILTEKENE
jgi:hypothetical protein